MLAKLRHCSRAATCHRPIAHRKTIKALPIRRMIDNAASRPEVTSTAGTGA
ncbi:MAG: hypothetical protein ABI665_05815 [Vicinamibacterales bacterium]